MKFVIPEKSIVYSEFLPKIFLDRPISNERPARVLEQAGLDCFHYLEKYLRDLKSYGSLYFRGDSHTTWLGSYFVYLFVIQTVNAWLSDSIGGAIAPIPLRRLVPTLAAYEGDLRQQLGKEHADALQKVWPQFQSPSEFELLVKYALPQSLNDAALVETPEDYAKLSEKRPLQIFEHSRTDLPRAVIFRDSTADFLIDLLAQHFSRSVFIWRDGMVFEDVIERERPNLVLHLSAERFLRVYPNIQSFERLSRLP